MGEKRNFYPDVETNEALIGYRVVNLCTKCDHLGCRTEQGVVYCHQYQGDTSCGENVVIKRPYYSTVRFRRCLFSLSSVMKTMK